ncbi:transcription repressor OFP8-like, partial [Neltuma alba]|uniref:transcription repressor OFP8-like n=1 Tax=Neltuma alba TaxID=207710 RepID=UPI0010A3C8B1
HKQRFFFFKIPSFFDSQHSLSLSLSLNCNGKPTQIRVSRMFSTSFGSCRTRNFSDVMEKAPHYHPPSSHLMEPHVPQTSSLSFHLQTKASQSLHAPCFDSLCDDLNGRSCLLASRSCENDKKEADDFGGNWCIAVTTNDETDTLFSSKSTSSDSSQSRRFRRRHRSLAGENGFLPLQVKVKDSFAVVKRSSDPYNDFRTSMEMIVEKQIFAAKDLENLLQCFLSLNSHHHHKIIVEVFTEIYDALFCDWV